jgi:NADH-quinone oxidoreductase subunit J
MNETQAYIGALAMVLAAIGMWLMLPRAGRPGRLLGAVLGVASLALFAALGARMDSTGAEVAFVTLAGVTVVAAAATVTFRSPVYCALWFALSLVGTAGLFLMQGAQFLGVATIVVYAGAILVTFLFVLMLAQPGGHAYYDSVSWQGMIAATTGAVMVGFLTMSIVRVLNPHVDSRIAAAIKSFRPEESGGLEARHIRRARAARGDDQTRRVEVELTDDAPILSLGDLDRLEDHLYAALMADEEQQVSAEQFDLVVTSVADPVLAAEPADRGAAGAVLAEEHVATLGAQLFSRHLAAIEVAGTLLLAALVGAIAIVAHERAPPQRHARPSKLRPMERS